MSTEDVSQLLPGEGQEPVEPVAAEPVAPEPEPLPEPYRMKYRGEERELPFEPVNGLAEALGTTPEGVVNALQRAREADRIFRENVAYQQQVAELQANAARYQERMGGGQAPPARYQPPPQYQQPYQAPQPQQADEDPMGYLRRVEQGLNLTRQEMREFIDAQRQHQAQIQEAQEQAMRLQQGQEIRSQLGRFLADKNKGRREPIELEDFSAEVSLMGGNNPYMPLDQAAERAFLWMTRDEQIQQARSETLDKLQQRRAVVTVPGSRGGAVAPAPAPANAADQLGSMTFGQGREFFPEHR